MSKDKKGPDYNKVMPTLVEQVEKVLEEADKHTYSTMGVFSAYNAAYGLNDKPQTCSSCLRARVNLLRDWMKGYKAQLKEKTPPSIGCVEHTKALILFLNGTSTAIRFTPTNEDKTEGTVIYADESEVVPGIYDISTGQVLEVLQDGIAIVNEKKVEPQYTDSDAPGYVQQVEGTVRYLMAEGLPFDFSPNEGTLVKGTVKLADGSNIKPGTYFTSENLRIVVQPGGKANIKEVEEDPNKDIDKAE